MSKVYYCQLRNNSSIKKYFICCTTQVKGGGGNGILDYQRDKKRITLFPRIDPMINNQVVSSVLLVFVIQ